VNHGFGIACALRNDIALIAATGAEAAFIFRHDGTGWQLEQELNPSFKWPVTSFGVSVSLSADGTVAVVGANQQDSQTGAAYVFRRDGSAWVLETELVPATPEGPFPFFGTAVSISASGGSILAGAPFDFAQGFESGAAHLFRHIDGAWQEIVKITPSQGSPGCFGISVALDEDLGLIGATGEGAPGIVLAYAGFSGRDCNGNAALDGCEVFDGLAEDENGNDVLDECESMGDLDGDGAVNVNDLVSLILQWGPCAAGLCPPACSGDTDGDCQVGIGDLITLLLNWAG
jgi:hypothetical protein